jgi:hypothetical protein
VQCAAIKRLAFDIHAAMEASSGDVAIHDTVQVTAIGSAGFFSNSLARARIWLRGASPLHKRIINRHMVSLAGGCTWWGAAPRIAIRAPATAAATRVCDAAAAVRVAASLLGLRAHSCCLHGSQLGRDLILFGILERGRVGVCRRRGWLHAG